MKFTKHKRVLLAASGVVVAVLVGLWLFSNNDKPVRKPDSSILGLYHSDHFGPLSKNVTLLPQPLAVRYLGRPLTVGGERTHSTVEYEIKANGRYTKHVHWDEKWGGFNGSWAKTLGNARPQADEVDSTITLHPDGSYTKSKSGTYTLSGRDLTLTSRIHRLDSFELGLFKEHPAYFRRTRNLSKTHFIKDGYECITGETLRVTKDGLLLFLRKPHISDEELKTILEKSDKQRRLMKSFGGPYSTDFVKTK